MLGPLIGAAVLTAVHITTGELGWLSKLPRRRLLSFAGGISVAYVFVELMPEIGDAQEAIERGLGGAKGLIKHHAYVLALVGLSAAYGMDTVAERHSRRRDVPAAGVFWTHVVSFALYSALIGYLLRTEDRNPAQLALYVVAMALHFVVSDIGLRRLYDQRFHRIGRWVLATGVPLGFAIAELSALNTAAAAAAMALLSGGIILNVLKEELPDNRNNRFVAFAIGAAMYTVLLLAGE